MRFTTFQLAWKALLSRLHKEARSVPGVVDKLSVGSDFGRRPRGYRELLGICFVIDNPRARKIRTKPYTPDGRFAIAQTILAITGSDDAESISHYNSRGVCFADETGHIPSALGRRIFRSSEGDQFQAAVNLLKRDQSSRRAQIQIYLPGDLVSPTRDSSCVGSLQFVVREGSLEAVATMRSQSAARVMPYDVYLLTMLQESAAVELGLQLGSYHHFSGSLHYYLDEEDLIGQILADDGVLEPKAMQPMLSPLYDIRERLALAEESSRLGRYPPPVDPYWDELVSDLKIK